MSASRRRRSTSIERGTIDRRLPGRDRFPLHPQSAGGSKKGTHRPPQAGHLSAPAPIGYLNQGGGKVELPDPVRARYIRDAFELYANGIFALRDLSDELWERGLRNGGGKQVYPNALAKIFRNPFYMGIIRMRGDTYRACTSRSYPKSYSPACRTDFDGKKNVSIIKHAFLFRRLIRCSGCGLHLIGERQKQKYVYYRCRQGVPNAHDP